MIAHLVLFNPRLTLGREQLRSFAKSVQDVCRSIEVIKRSRVGRRVTIDAGYSRVFGDKTYQFAAVFEFDDAAGLGAYLNHPLHHHLGRLFWETCESSVVFEMEARDGRDETLVDFLSEDLI